MFCVFCNLCSPLAGAERSSRVCQGTLNPLSGRVRASHHAPRDPLRVLERCHGLAAIVERGTGTFVERQRVNPLHPERDELTLSENASRHESSFAQQCLAFFEVP